MSQMMVTQMSITETTESPQHKLHWLAEQALSWSGLPVVTVRPTVFLEGFFLLLAAVSVRDADELALPMGTGKTSPVSSVDVARAVAAILYEPAPHIGHIYDLTGPESADLDHYARVFSEALGRTIRYRDAPTSEWSEKLRAAGVSEHVAHHLTVMTELHKQGRYDRMSEAYFKLTGETPTSMADFVKLHAAEIHAPVTLWCGAVRFRCGNWFTEMAGTPSLQEMERRPPRTCRSGCDRRQLELRLAAENPSGYRHTPSVALLVAIGKARPHHADVEGVAVLAGSL